MKIDATGLPGGLSRSPLFKTAWLAISVTYHGASPWHPDSLRPFCFSCEHDAPPGKPMVSTETYT
ncbi:MAG TPA: hypothetical protein VN643_00030 [Pyrinomonadaceae bacterium]|nr:hypothetical protein [Pyrinomonadaceae bacterium]